MHVLQSMDPAWMSLPEVLDKESFVAGKVVFLVTLVNQLCQSVTLDLKNTEDFLRIMFLAACDKQCVNSVSLQVAVSDCIANLLQKTAVDETPGVILQITEFCLNLVPDMSTRVFIVQNLCPCHKHAELRKCMAFKVLQQFAESETECQSFPTVAKGLPTVKDLFNLLSHQQFPLLHANRTNMRKLDSVQLSTLYQLLRVIDIAVGNVYVVPRENQV